MHECLWLDKDTSNFNLKSTGWTRVMGIKGLVPWIASIININFKFLFSTIGLFCKSHWHILAPYNFKTQREC